MFKLTITLGNDAMQTGDDIARALRAVAATVEGGGYFDDPTDESGFDRTGRIRDDNGNAVGKWEVVL